MLTKFTNVYEVIISDLSQELSYTRLLYMHIYKSSQFLYMHTYVSALVYAHL